MAGAPIHFHVSSNKRSPPTSPSKIPTDVDNPPFYLPLKSFNGRYKIVSNLGNGSFGSVGLAKSTQNLLDFNKFKTYKNTLLERDEFYKHENYFNKKTGLVAIKTMNKKLNELNDYTTVKEIKFVLAIPYHQNLVQVYEMFIDNLNFKLHIVMECMDQNLYQLIKARKNNFFSQTTLRSILSQILCGIRHIHRNHYFHRDIKPENILVTPSNRFYDQAFINSKEFKFHDSFIVKIADYGLARHVDNKRPYTSYVSTRWYRAPEILFRKNWYSRPVDVWAFGSVAAEVATFRPLFPGADECEQTWKVLDILGTPLSRNNISGYYPTYGYWDEVQSLSTNIGLRLPLKKCVDISLLIPNPELSELCDVIKACLAWDPQKRSDVEDVCTMPYFKGTCVDDFPASKVVPIPVQSSVNVFKNYSNNNNNHNYTYSKAGILAGIPTLQSNVAISTSKDQDSDYFDDGDAYDDDEKEYHENESSQHIEYVEEDEADSREFSPNATETNYSFINDDFVKSSAPSNNKIQLDSYANDQGFSNEKQVPNSTQDSMATNDENINGFQSYNYEQEHQFHNKSLRQFPNVYNSLRSNNDPTPNIDPNNIYYHPQPMKTPTFHPFQNNTLSNGIDEFDAWNQGKAMNVGDGAIPNIVQDTNMNLDSILSDNLEDSFKYHGTFNDSLLGLSNDRSFDKGDQSNNSIDSNNIPQFTGELLSKFSLRRIPQLEDTTKYQN